MAEWWLGVFAFLLQALIVRPQCIVCTSECEEYEANFEPYVNITVECDLNATEFFQTSNLTNLYSIKFISPSIQNLNLSKLSNAKIVNFSNNNLTWIDVSVLKNVQDLIITKNSLSKIEGNLTNLKYVDLSFNLINEISKCQILNANVTYISLNNNNLKSINYSSCSLEHFDLKNNKIESVDLKKFPNLKILDLSNNSIVKIINLSNAPKLEILNLSSNRLEELSNYNFNLTNLLKLDLRGNKLKILSAKCFAGVNKLQYLDISKNKLIAVFPSTLQFSGLIQLAISENELSSQDFGLLLASKRLKSVDASRTNQKKIPSSLTRSVRYLNLSYNNITQIQCGDMDSYPLLNDLDISHNKLNYIEDDALGRLELLTTLFLNHNLLTSIPYTLPNNLKILNISNNLINKITTTDFLSITILKKLDLSYNRITTIAEGSFSQMSSLMELNLSGNNIKILSSSIFTSQHNLRVLDLSELVNVTKCDRILCFPVPEPNKLQELNLQKSPVLVQRLLNDVAALKTFKQLNVLNLANSNLTDIINLSNYFPRLRYLYLQGNKINCSTIHSMYSWLEINEENCKFTMNEITTTEFYRKESTTLKYESTVVYFENNTNEIIYKESDLGVVDALSTTPSSHPGLLILLVLPIALVSTCLILHYSRSRRQTDMEESSEMDIEISNISSELW